jgi:hypothetical protein
LQAVRRRVQRGRAFGEEQGSDRVVHRLGFETTIRPRGRPRNGFLTPLPSFEDDRDTVPDAFAPPLYSGGKPSIIAG